MAPAAKLIVAMVGLVLLTALALTLIAFPHSDALTQLPGLAVVTAISAVAAMMGFALARAPARTREKLAALASEQNGPEAELAQHALRERTLSSTPIMSTTPDGLITAWNLGAERLYGHLAADAIGQSVEIIVPADRREEHSAVLARLRDGLSVGTFETVRVARDGRRIDVSVSASPVRSATGETIGVFTITRDISAQKIAEEKFHLAVEACPSGIFMIDGAGKIVMVNTEVERLFGYGRDELMGQLVDLLIPERLSGQHRRHREGLALQPKRRTGVGLDLFGRRKDGSEFPVEVSLNPIHAREGDLVLGVIVDISERKRLDRLKDEFVSIVSHELRTPLASIAGSLGLLIGGAAGKLPKRATRLLTIAQTNGQRLVRLVNDILDIEKMESGQVVFNFKRVEVRSLVQQAIEANRGFADGYGVQLRLDEASVARSVHADPDRLSQVVTNLLSNAIKFSPRDAEVVVAVEARDRDVRISVRDHGSGIPADFRPRIFEKFAQADAGDARQKGGTGLGLSIVKQIVTRLDGKVGFDDAPGGGTIFHVDLPGWDEVADRQLDREGSADAIRLLLCEDDPDAATDLREGLRPFGFRTDFAYCADEVFECASAADYAAILVDRELADGGGNELIERLREMCRAPIVVISDAAIHHDPRWTGGDMLECVVKPVDVERLAQVLDRVVRAERALPKILHVDDDREVLEVVAEALDSTAQVVSVESIDRARQALAADRFDLAVLDIMVAEASGLDLLPYLRTRGGLAIPVILFSAHDAALEDPSQIQASFGKSHEALEGLVAAVRDRLTPCASLPKRRSYERDPHPACR